MKRGGLGSFVLIALFSAIISVSAFISIPFFALPITMQSLGIALSLFLLGGKRGALSVLLYIFIGAVGLPVFSGFTGGFGALFGANGGFIFGFIIEAFIFLLLEALLPRNDYSKIIAYTISHIVLYFSGALWYFLGFTGGESFLSVLSLLVLPYILPDIVKLFVAFLIYKKINGKIQL